MPAQQSLWLTVRACGKEKMACASVMPPATLKYIVYVGFAFVNVIVIS